MSIPSLEEWEELFGCLEDRSEPNSDQVLVQITSTMLVNKSFGRSFPTSLINGRNDYNGVVVNAVNVVCAATTRFI